MSATFAPTGFVPSYHPTGLDRGTQFTIAAAYNTPIYKYGVCTLNTNGTVTVGAVAADILGVFNGVQWTDAQQKPNYLNYWPGAQSGATNIIAWVWNDPATVFTVQADGSIAQTAIGDQADPTTATVASGRLGAVSSSKEGVIGCCAVSSTAASPGGSETSSISMASIDVGRNEPAVPEKTVKYAKIIRWMKLARKNPTPVCFRTLS